jgi:hypothetical protein
MGSANKISRRRLLRNAAAISVAGGAESAALSASQMSARSSGKLNGRPRTLALVGDYAHNCDAIRVSLDRLFKELDLSIDYTTNYCDLSKSLLEPYQLFVFFRDNYIFPNGRNLPANRSQGAAGAFAAAEYWITEEQGQAVNDFVTGGKGLYACSETPFGGPPWRP